MVDSPSGGAPANAPRWDLADTEGYGGGNCVSVAPVGVKTGGSRVGGPDLCVLG